MVDPERRTSAKAFLDKAEEILLLAQIAEEGALWHGVAVNSIHSGINAKDAIAVWLTGKTTKHQDHMRAADELDTLLTGHSDRAGNVRALQQLLSKKSAIEYSDDRRTPEATARMMLRYAERLVEKARELVR